MMESMQIQSIYSKKEEVERFQDGLDEAARKLRLLVHPGVLPETERTYAMDLFGYSVSHIPEVVAAYAIVNEAVIDLWTIVEGDLYEAEGKIIEVENELLDRFPDLSFDFMVLPKRNEKWHEMLPSNRIELYLPR